VKCRVPLSADDVRTLEAMVAQIGQPTGAKPSDGQLASVMVRMHLDALKHAGASTAAPETAKQDMEQAVARNILQQMIDEQLSPLRWPDRCFRCLAAHARLFWGCAYAQAK